MPGTRHRRDGDQGQEHNNLAARPDARHSKSQMQRRIWVGGNIGGSLLADLPRIAGDDIVVLELSSYMLHYLGKLRWSPHLAVVTMLSRDHVEWHGSAESYIEAKLNIVRFQQAHDIAVLNVNDPAAAPFIHGTVAKVIDYGGERRPISLQLPGKHNQRNAQAALAAAMALGISFEAAENAVRDFVGLPHRLQVVHHAEGVRWINDSIATIPEAAVAALLAFPPRKVIQIVGGSDKHLPMDVMIDALRSHAKAVLCIGQTGPTIALAMEQSENAEERAEQRGEKSRGKNLYGPSDCSNGSQIVGDGR